MSNSKDKIDSSELETFEAVFKYLDENGIPESDDELAERTGVSRGTAYNLRRIYQALQEGEKFFQTGYANAPKRKQVVDLLNAKGDMPLHEIVKATDASDGTARNGKLEWLAAKHGIISTQQSVDEVTVKKPKTEAQKKQLQGVSETYDKCRQEIEQTADRLFKSIIKKYGKSMAWHALDEWKRGIDHRIANTPLR